MTYAAVGAIQGGSGSPVPSVSVTTTTIGNFVLAEVINTGTATATALSSSHCTWTPLGSPFTGSVNTGTCQCFLGVVTTATTALVSPTWGAGTTNVFSSIGFQEFSTTTGTPVLDKQGHIDSAGTATWASLTPAAAGEAYFGFAINAGSATNGSTSGYTYGNDGSGNGIAQNAACGAGAQAPVWGDSGQQLGVMVLVMPAGGGPPPAVPGSRPGLPPVRFAPLTKRFGPAPPFWVPNSPSPPAPPQVTVATAGVATVSAVATLTPPKLYLTSIAGSGTGQYFTDQAGAPFLARGDAAWALVSNAGYAGGATTYQTDIDLYMSTRASQGFNVTLIDCITTTGEGLSNTRLNGNTWDGVAPFTGSIGTLNSSYWTRVDYAVTSAAANGITVFLVLADKYVLNNGGAAMSGMTTGQATTYGAALASRYAASPNIVWVFGNDYNDTNNSIYDNILAALRSGGDTHLATIENLTEGDSRFSDLAGTSYSWGTANAQFNFVYSYGGNYPCLGYAYTESSPLCVLLGDGWYDGTGFGTIPAAERDFMRQQIWWTLSSGSRGYMYGDQSLISWNPHTRFTSPPAFAATDLAIIWGTFASWAGWHQLVPDTGNVLVTANRGTSLGLFASNTAGSYTGQASDLGGAPNYYVSASITPGGTLAVLYLSDATGGHTGGAVTIDQTKMATGYTATWVDPANGATVTATTGSTYTRSTANSQGGADWVLLLQGPAAVTVTAGVAAVTAAAVTAVTAHTATAGVATAAAAAVQPAVAVTATAGVATVSAAAVTAVTAHTATAGVAIAAATAVQPAIAITVTAGVAIAAAAAVNPAVSTSGSTTANAGVATVTATAPPPAIAIGVTAGVAVIAATAPAAVPAVTVNAGVATVATAAVNPAVAVAVTATAGVATVSATAPQPAIAITVTAGVAIVLTVAPAATVNTSGSTNAVAGVATAAATAAQPAAAVTATAGVAIVLATAPAATPAVSATAGVATAAATAVTAATAHTVTAGVAIAAAAAVNPAVSTSGSTNVNAGVAAVTASAPQPVATPAITVTAGVAAVTTTAPAAAVTIGAVAPAGVATVLAVARAPSLAIAATAQAATVLAVALKVPPPFTIGHLTASDAPAGVLTAGTAPGGSGGVLTASDGI